MMESGPKRPSPLRFWGPNSIIVVYMDPLGRLFRVKVGSRVEGLGLDARLFGFVRRAGLGFRVSFNVLGFRV